MKNYLATSDFINEIRYWLSAFNGKESFCPHCPPAIKEETNVLQEGKKLLFKFFKRKEGKNSGDHLHGSKEGGEVREEVVREGGKAGSPSMGILDTSMGIWEEGEGKEDAIFEVREDGNSWVYKNIYIEHQGVSEYLVQIKSEEDKEGTIVCYVPHFMALLLLLNYLVQGRRPLFSSSAEHKPLA